MDDLDKMFDNMPAPEENEALSFVIDEDMRIITVPEKGVVLGVEGDKDVNRVRFVINRYYHGNDFSEFTIRINYENANGEPNYFTVTERTAGDEQLSFIWTVSSDVTAAKGTVRFVVNCFTISEDGIVTKAYHTTVGTAQVLEGIDVNAAMDTPEVADLLTRLERDLTVHVGSLIEKATTAADSAEKSAQEAKQSEAKSEQNAAAAQKAKEDAENNAQSTSDMLAKLVADYNGGCLGLYDVVLPASSWTKNSDTGYFVCTAAMAASKAIYMPIAVVSSDDAYAAQEAALSGICETMDGKMKFSAGSKPAKDLHIQVTLLIPDVSLKG